MTNQLSSLNSKIESLPAVSEKSAVIRSADDVLTQIEACRQLLFNRTDITRKGLNEGIVSDRFLDSKDIPQDLLLSSTNPPPAMKLYNTLNNFIAELEKMPGYQDIAKQAKDIFELNDLPTGEQAWPYRMFQGQYLTWILVELDNIENYVRVIKTEAIN